MPTAPRVVVALGSGVDDDSTLSEPSAARLEEALQIVKANPEARLLTTRTHGDHGETSDRGQERMVVRAGLTDRWKLLRDSVETTYDEAVAVRREAGAGAQIVVVTSPLHTRRACAIFEHAGLRVTCRASRQYPWWFVPYAVAYESAAWIKNKAMGRL